MIDSTSSREYQVCSHTVMDTSDPSITFDDSGISNHYWDFHNNISLIGFKVLLVFPFLSVRLMRLSRRENKPYDCILGLSGGLDSSYMLHKVVTEFNLRPLLFHVDAGWNTDTAVSNINALVSKLGLDLYTEVVNWNELRDFQLAFQGGIPH